MDRSNIIIVDDTKDVLSSLQRELRKEPYNVFYASGGEEALTIISENPCKVIISDIKMVKMDGFELLAKVKEKYPDMIRVVLSGHSDVKLILDLVNKGGIYRYLTKPWEAEDIKATIEQCIELFDLRKEVIELRNKLAAVEREKSGK
ncbi:MAG: response regulator [Desulfatiglans sp.]|nr:response regulator [Thermodesulfobacteriota bacterium]MEE4353077.1 response regulator [Desulfatiglans sp.]